MSRPPQLHIRSLRAELRLGNFLGGKKEEKKKKKGEMGEMGGWGVQPIAVVGANFNAKINSELLPSFIFQWETGFIVVVAA